jgi:hypothetical protein
VCGALPAQLASDVAVPSASPAATDKKSWSVGSTAVPFTKPSGERLLVGVEHIVLQAAWDAEHDEAPTLFDQEFHLVPSPNRYGLPPSSLLKMATIDERMPSF